ncbi:DUF2889 domain-containing protein [Pseudorhodoferax sp. Leaf267]|uniref:DUF2889 domain-containing protein n=1 Tax=Pseudorhodoferax sp. Leaf267 TaxID=1736316 RepID=UPI0006F96626|nr:DUF2889 domain-containing protein [Pseudorhodoferax sp. Leaf267]KQP23333.1 hypothetical protein ASF43_05575 [Pseudorhodoferax sp. Leaf267]
MKREELHHRQIDLRFYRRGDGHYEVVGRLLDTKSHPFRRQLAAGDTPPGTPIHDIAVHLVIDEDMLVHDAFASMEATPFTVCPGATGTLAPLKGLSLRNGWNRQVRELLGGAASCTHIVELLGPMATTAFQGLAPKRLAEINLPGSEAQRLAKVDSCYAYAGEREVVAQLWPHLHRP